MKKKVFRERYAEVKEEKVEVKPKAKKIIETKKTKKERENIENV